MKRPTQADVVAAEYFEKVHDWTGIRPDRPDSLARVNARVPVEIGHLSFGRLGLSEEDKSWPYQQMWRELASVVEVFVSAVPDDCINPTFREHAKALLPGYRSVGVPELITNLGRESIGYGVGVTNTSTETRSLTSSRGLERQPHFRCQSASPQSTGKRARPTAISVPSAV